MNWEFNKDPILLWSLYKEANLLSRIRLLEKRLAKRKQMIRHLLKRRARTKEVDEKLIRLINQIRARNYPLWPI